MKWQRMQREEPDINLTPLIDVVFLLLIFFMVSTTFDHESQISIELPQAKATSKQDQKQSLEVLIDAKGHFYVNDHRLVNTQIDTLKRAIRQAAGDRKNPVFVISADANTPHQAVVTAMDAARQVGITHMSIATRNRQSDQKP